MKKYKDMFSKFQTREFKVGSIATAITVVVVAAIIVLNLIVGQLTDKFSLHIDLTQNKIFSLTEPSINFIKNLNKDVEIVILSDESAFSQANAYFSQANSVLKQYNLNSSKIKLTYIDPVKNPTYVNNYEGENLTESNIIVKCGDKYKIVTMHDLFDIQRSYYGSNITGSKAEQEITSAILYVTSEDQIKIVMLKGYGEQDSTAFEEILKKNNFNVLEVSLLTQEIPEDAKLAIVYGPERDYDASAIGKIEKFLSKEDKNLVYALNPSQASSPNLNALFLKYNIKIKEGIVYETNTQNIVSSIFESINEYVDEDYKSNVKNSDIPVLMPFAKPIELTSAENTTTLLQFSSSTGVFPKGADKNFDFKGHISGPIPSAVLSKSKSGEDKASNVVVITTYGALSQEYLSSNALNNSTYFVNMINKMTQKEDIGFTIESKRLGGEELGVSLATANTIGIIMTMVLPVAVLIVGVIVFLKRKNM